MMQRPKSELCLFILVWLTMLWYSIVAAAEPGSAISSKANYNSNVYSWTTSLETETHLTPALPKPLGLFLQRSFLNLGLRATLKQNVRGPYTGMNSTTIRESHVAMLKGRLTRDLLVRRKCLNDGKDQ